jgi:hypothetical protein
MSISQKLGGKEEISAISRWLLAAANRHHDHSSRPRTATATTPRSRELLPRPLFAVANCYRDHSSRPRTATATTLRGRELLPRPLFAAANCYRDHSSRSRTATATTLRGRELLLRPLFAAANCYRDHFSRPRTDTANLRKLTFPKEVSKKITQIVYTKWCSVLHRYFQEFECAFKNKKVQRTSSSIFERLSKVLLCFELFLFITKLILNTRIYLFLMENEPNQPPPDQNTNVGGNSTLQSLSTASITSSTTTQATSSNFQTTPLVIFCQLFVNYLKRVL